MLVTHKEDIKVLIMVLHANLPPWDRLAQEGIRGTWWGVPTPGVTSLFYQGGGTEISLKGDILEVDVPEGPHTMGRKNLKAFKFALDNFQFDYMFRVNASSYVDKAALLAFLQDKPSTGLYAGVINGTYVSGAGILMSRDVVEMIDKNGYALMHGSPPDEPLWVPEPEDVYLGWLVKSLGVKFTEGSRYNVFEDDRGPTRLPIPFPRKYYHYRCKNTEDREKDIWAMKEIHKELGGHMSTYDEIIERFKDAEVSYENVFANSPGVAASLRMKGVHQPWSLKEVEFHIMQETVKINGLLRGYEVATAFGISTLGIGLGFKETGGRLVTMDAYIEENSVDGAAYRHEFDKKFYDSKGYRSVTNLIKCYGLQETVYPTVGWSPIDTVSCLSGTFNLDKEKLDFVFIDAGHWDEALLKDVQSVLPFLNQDKYVIFIHDTHGFSKGGLAAVEKLVGNSIVWLPSCMPHDGFCLSYIAKGVEVFQG